MLGDNGLVNKALLALGIDRHAAAAPLQSVQRAARHGADPAAADHRHAVRRHAAHRPHADRGREDPRRQRMAGVPHRVLSAQPAGRLRRRPAGVRAGARLLRDAGAARQPARDHDRADHHGRGEPAARLAAGERGRRGAPRSSPRRSPRSTTATSASTACGEAPTNERDGRQARAWRGGRRDPALSHLPGDRGGGDLVQRRQFPGVPAARPVAALVSRASPAIRNG